MWCLKLKTTTTKGGWGKILAQPPKWKERPKHAKSRAYPFHMLATMHTSKDFHPYHNFVLSCSTKIFPLDDISNTSRERSDESAPGRRYQARYHEERPRK